jgi:hypothetical protein
MLFIKGIADRYLLEMFLIILIGNILFGNGIKSITSINLIVLIICEYVIVLVIRRLIKGKSNR